MIPENQFDCDYSKEVAKRMRKVLESVVSDIDFDIERWSIEDVLNGIDYNRWNKFKDVEHFKRSYHCSDLLEHQIADIIGTAIGLAYYDRFVDEGAD